MLHVTGAVPAPPPSVEQDPYVPLRIRWAAPKPGGVLYLRLDGTDGGELEFKVDAVSGQLLGVVVLADPPPTGNPAGGGSITADGGATLAGCPLVDRTPWQPNPDGVPRSTVVRVSGPLHTAGPVLVFAGPPVAWYRSGNVSVGVDADDNLAALQVDSTR